MPDRQLRALSRRSRSSLHLAQTLGHIHRPLLPGIKGEARRAAPDLPLGGRDCTGCQQKFWGRGWGIKCLEPELVRRPEVGRGPVLRRFAHRHAAPDLILGLMGLGGVASNLRRFLVFHPLPPEGEQAGGDDDAGSDSHIGAEGFSEQEHSEQGDEHQLQIGEGLHCGGFGHGIGFDQQPVADDRGAAEGAHPEPILQQHRLPVP